MSTPELGSGPKPRVRLEARPGARVGSCLGSGEMVVRLSRMSETLD